MYHTTTSAGPTGASYTNSAGRPLAGQQYHNAGTSLYQTGPPTGNVPNLTYVANSPKHRSFSPTLMTIAPNQNQPLRDWEGFAQQAEIMNRSIRSPATPRQGTGYAPPIVKRAGSPSVAVLKEATERGEESYSRWRARNSPERGLQLPTSPYNPRGVPNQPDVPDRGPALLDHQGYLAWKRDEYRRMKEAEERGEVYTPREYNGQSYLMRNGDVSRSINISTDPRPGPGSISIDFRGRKRDLPVQVLATADELAWLEPPPIPEPIGWNGHWDLCAGHELILQHMAVSGATPQNSPSLTEHFMYPELISCVQRLLVGTYLVRYSAGYEPPHERYFYIRSLPLATKAQYAPFLCWSVHKNSHNASDCIPLCNIMWVTQGMHSPNFRKYYIGGNSIQGPFVGKRKVECLAYGCFTVWHYDGKNTKGLDLLATDPLCFTMWMKLLEDIAQLNAALDTSGNVRKMQKYIETLREEGTLGDGVEGKKKRSWLDSFKA